MERNNEYGKIKITENVFHRIIKNAVWTTNEKVTLASERKNIYIADDESSLNIEFRVIIRFGASIRINSNLIMNYLEDTLKPMQIGKPIHIVMRIVGIRSRNIAKRDIEVTRDII